ncbi:DNA binding domain-containing protein (plasmid) [Butyrivibrio proteoclasticus B316]|uniref:DNA binding domain-containing protein n=1 Tax=Butyrivibrio proteoclasticus (strain ATCC 51982 / DSM 14932 / B316) TaxID=515622 RepID=E0S548_BUTPB|nr:helix-turn-helix domain-containing protein [Butyrivibrio proteoclasticus]ADL36530.1 DNA binding domain-containing protein [Butyrivibrio proteoclasticus B316]
MKTYTVNDIAELLHTNPETVRRWIREKKLKATKSSNKEGNEIAESDFEKFLKASPKYASVAGISLISAGIGGGVVSPALSAIGIGTVVVGEIINDVLKNNDNTSEIQRYDIQDFIDIFKNHLTSNTVKIKAKKEEVEKKREEIANLQADIDKLEKKNKALKSTLKILLKETKEK